MGKSSHRIEPQRLVQPCDKFGVAREFPGQGHEVAAVVFLEFFPGQPPEFEPTFQPTYGLLINAEELEAVRREFAQSPAMAELRASSDYARTVRPESLIGEHMNFWSANTLRRERDYNKMLSLHGPIAAQAGLDWDTVGAALKRDGRLHLETY